MGDIINIYESFKERGSDMEDKTFLKNMGKRICKKRRELAMTQEELAEKIDVSTQMISNLESGKKAIRPENLAKICKALDISADYVLTGSEHARGGNFASDKIANFTEKELAILSQIIEYMHEKNSNEK